MMLRQIIRATISLLSVHKVLVVPTAPSFDSITGKFTGTDENASSFNFESLFGVLGLSISSIREE